MARKFDQAHFALLIEKALETGPLEAPQRLSQKDLAALVDVDPATIYRWATGKTSPSRAVVERMAGLFGWPPPLVDDLFLRSPVKRAMADQDLTSWLEVTGLRPDFPTLRRPAWVYLDPWNEDLERLRPAIRMPASRPAWVLDLLRFGGGRVLEFPVGHGISTTMRAAHFLAVSDVFATRQIPVALSLEDLVTASYDELVTVAAANLAIDHPQQGFDAFDESDQHVAEISARGDDLSIEVLGGITPATVGRLIERQMHLAVVRALLAWPWEVKHIDSHAYRRHLGVEHDLGDLDGRRALLRRLVPAKADGDWSQLGVLAPDLAAADSGRLSRTINARILLLIDLSPTPAGRTYLGPTYGEHLTRGYDRAAQALLRALRSVAEPGVDGSSESPLDVDLSIAMPQGAMLDMVGGLGDLRQRVRTVPPLQPLDLYDLLRPGAFRPDVRMSDDDLDRVLDYRYVHLLPNCSLTTGAWLLGRTLALARDRRIVDGGDQATAHRLGRLLFDLEPADLDALVRMLELLGFERHQRGRP